MCRRAPRGFPRRMSSRYSRLAGRQGTIPNIPAQAESCLPPGLPALPSEPASGHRPEHSRPRWCHCQARLTSSSLCLEEGGGAPACCQGRGGAASTGEGKPKGPGRACEGGPGPPWTPVRFRMRGWALGRNSDVGPGCKRQPHTLEGRVVTVEGGPSSRTFCQDGNVLDPPRPGGSPWPATGGPSPCKGTGVGQDGTDQLHATSMRVHLGSREWLAVTRPASTGQETSTKGPGWTRHCSHSGSPLPPPNDRPAA